MADTKNKTRGKKPYDLTLPEIIFMHQKFSEWKEKGYITKDLVEKAGKSEEVPLATSGVRTYLGGKIYSIEKGMKLIKFIDLHITKLKNEIINTEN